MNNRYASYFVATKDVESSKRATQLVLRTITPRPTMFISLMILISLPMISMGENNLLNFITKQQNLDKDNRPVQYALQSQSIDAPVCSVLLGSDFILNIYV